MKKKVILFIFAATAYALHAQGAIYDHMPLVTVHQDSAVTQLMEDHWTGTVRGEQEIPGWRLQIYSSNNQLAAKQEAEALKEQLETEIKEPVYVNFIQPFWKVRIGNFKTVEEAKAYKEELVKQFPELQAESYPVKDMIIIKK